MKITSYDYVLNAIVRTNETVFSNLQGVRAMMDAEADAIKYLNKDEHIIILETMQDAEKALQGSTVNGFIRGFLVLSADNSPRYMNILSHN